MRRHALSGALLTARYRRAVRKPMYGITHDSPLLHRDELRPHLTF